MLLNTSLEVSVSRLWSVGTLLAGFLLKITGSVVEI